MAIRFDKSYNSEIRKVVKNFNQKRNRAIKRGVKNLPPPLTVSELKSRYETRAALNKDLGLIRKFNTNEALKTVETSGGAKAIKWEYEYLKKNLNEAKSFYDREIKNASRLDTPLRVAKKDYINNLKAKRDYLDLEYEQLNQSQFRTFRKTINSALNYNNITSANYRGWLKEVEIIMRQLGYGNKEIDRFFEGFDELSPQEFITAYRQSNLVSRIYELYVPRRDGSFQLSTDEDDAKDLINTFMIEKNDMIKKAKRSVAIENKGIVEYVKSLNEKELAELKEEGHEALKRKNLTDKDIKDLKTLGWDDLIEE